MTVSAASVAVTVSVAVAGPAAVIVMVSAGATEGQVDGVEDVDRALTAVALEDASGVANAVLLDPSEVSAW